MKDSGLVIATDSQITAPAMVAADIAIEVPSIFHPEYLKNLKDIIYEYEISAIIPLNDLELPFLARNKVELESLGAKVIVSNKELINICSDKWETHSFLESIGVRTPKTYLKISDTLKGISKGHINFPVIVKPRWGSGSFGIEEAGNEMELQLVVELLRIRLKKSLLENLNLNNVDDAIIIQEKLAGEEYGIDVLNDFKGRHICSFVKRKLAMRSGETDKALTVKNEVFDNLGKQIAEHTNHFGTMDLDIFLSNGQPYILELNPRFGGGYPFTHEAGGNIAGIYVDWLKGLDNISHHLKFKADKMFSKYDLLVECKTKLENSLNNLNL